MAQSLAYRATFVPFVVAFASVFAHGVSTLTRRPHMTFIYFLTSSFAVSAALTTLFFGVVALATTGFAFQ